MGGGGSMAGMNASRKYNSSLLGSSRQRKHDAYERVMDSSKLEAHYSHRKKLSDEEIQKIKLKYQQERKISNRRLGIGVGIFVILTLGGIFVLLRSMQVF